MGVLSLIVSGLWFVGRQRGLMTPESLQQIRLTDFPDAVHSAALSPDGQMLAFVRGAEPFLLGPGELYVKVLPDGQPVALTGDGTQKMAPAFTPDGSHIVFTGDGFSSLSVPIGDTTRPADSPSQLHYSLQLFRCT
jgi:Tol biopolymer transport system component